MSGRIGRAVKFNINDYNENFVMHCKTKKEAQVFLKYLSESGKTWNNGQSYLHRDNFYQYGSDTCYRFHAGIYCSLSYYRDTGLHILEFNDFDWGDIVEKELEVSPDDTDVINSFISGFKII